MNTLLEKNIYIIKDMEDDKNIGNEIEQVVNGDGEYKMNGND